MRAHRYTELVFRSLHNLAWLDGVANPTPLNAVQHSAIAFLDKHAAANPNNIKRIDLRGRGMRREHFPWIMAALAELPVQTIWLTTNPWDHGVGKRFHDYRRFVIAAMDSNLYVPSPHLLPHPSLFAGVCAALHFGVTYRCAAGRAERRWTGWISQTTSARTRSCLR